MEDGGNELDLPSSKNYRSRDVAEEAREKAEAELKKTGE